MKYPKTVLSVVMVVYLILCLVFSIVYSVLNFDDLSLDHRYGVTYMIILISIGLVGIGIDKLLGAMFKNKKIQNIVGLILALVFALWLFPQLLR